MTMMAAGLVTVVGLGVTFAGILASPLYDVGVMVTLLGLVGLVVRSGELVRSRLQRRGLDPPGRGPTHSR